VVFGRKKNEKWWVFKTVALNIGVFLELCGCGIDVVDAVRLSVAVVLCCRSRCSNLASPIFVSEALDG
jgi:hypothetical protein